jgi:octaprenyl-diphosphate synthase
MTPVEQLHGPVTQALEDTRRIFDAELTSELPFVNELCERIGLMRGKMLRPSLLLLTGQACGGIEPEHLTLGAVVEMVHIATLVHDDILDEAQVRRGMRTFNYAEGNEAAVLLGDYLISHAFHLCSSLDSQFASRAISSVTDTVCEGELMQIHHRGNHHLTEAEYFEIIDRKTASLTGVCGRLGATFAKADPEVVERMERYGRDAGMAFQITDDILDLTGTQEDVGKTLGRDLDKQKMTLPMIRFLASASRPLKDETMALLKGGAEDGHARIREMLETGGAIDEAYDVADRHIQSALKCLETLPASEAKDALQATAEFILLRRV